MYPDDLRYTPEHEWIRRESPTVLRFGITSFAAEALGDVVFVALPAMGASLTAGQPCGEVESTKSVSDLYAPLDGAVVGVNSSLEDAPEMVNAEPYGEGWMVDVECATSEEADAAWSALLTAGQYADGLT
ncbi:MAG TPA: glycine cleavage system protein GcvH [Motilibacterales bacterium]|nr:glycine cleavage system protein GcvH [Motilibacterales bacterium]